MSRHRIVRAMNYNDEYDDYDDVYGTSTDDDSCISPTDAQRWLFDRSRGQQSMSAFIRDNKNIEEENEVDAENVDEFANTRRDSDNFQFPMLDDMSKAKLNSCIEEVRNVVGDTISERRIVESSMKFDYDFAKVLDDILNEGIGKNVNKVKLNTVTSLSDVTKINKITEPTNILKSSQPIKTNISNENIDCKPETSAIKVTTALKDTREIRLGFEVTPLKVDTSPETSQHSSPIPSPEDMTKASVPNAIFKVSKEQATRNAEQMYNKERACEKNHFYMIVIGHVDAGKSTLMGHLLFDMGNVSQRVMHKHEQESKKMGKQSFMYAWVLDETGEERERGITMDVGQSRIETATKVVTLLDAPGHKDFIPNMISGATQADVALLVIDATRGEFETGFELGGQTREHALLVRSLGVAQLGVVINKLDTVNWSKERFDDIVAKLRAFLKQVGFKDSDVCFVPCSGLTGENLCKPATESKLKCWYKGPHLLDVIDNFKIPTRSVDRPLRMSVSDVYKASASGFCIDGRIETGVLSLNDRVLVGTNREQGQIKSLQINDMPHINAFAGDQVTVSVSGVEINNIGVGCIISDPMKPIPVTSRFRARILTFNLKFPITIGYPVVLHHQSLIEPAVITKLIAQLHKATGEVTKKNPRFLTNNVCALVQIETTKPICIERFADFKELGRIALRINGVTIAAGMVMKVCT